MSGSLGQWTMYGHSTSLFTYINGTSAPYVSTIRVPSNVRNVVIQCWGGGGYGGAGDAGIGIGGGGGGGGAYSSCVLPIVSPGANGDGACTINFSVGGYQEATTIDIVFAPPISGFPSYTTIVTDGGNGGGNAFFGSPGGAGGIATNTNTSSGAFLGTPNQTINTDGISGGNGSTGAGGSGGTTSLSLGPPYPTFDTATVGFGAAGGYPGGSLITPGGGAVYFYFY